MYSRSKKDNFRKKIEDLIEGRQKRQQKCSSNDADSIININVSNENNDNVTSNKNNDNATSNANKDITSSEISNNRKIHVQRWTPGSLKFEGIHKYLNII
jgi:hypothetical protein